MKTGITCVSILIILAFAGCKKPDSNPGTGPNNEIIVTNSGCKTHFIVLAGSGFDCIRYSLQNNTLHIKHINAAFNCCPNKITVTADVKDTIINITEQEILNNPCKCNCLYDLDYDLPNVSKNKVRLKVNEPYVDQGKDKLDFTIDLSLSDTGTYCLPRNQYPWGM
jgi:hypothetical protein